MCTCLLPHHIETIGEYCFRWCVLFVCFILNEKGDRRVRPTQFASNDTDTALGQDGSDLLRDLATLTFDLGGPWRSWQSWRLWLMQVVKQVLSS